MAAACVAGRLLGGRWQAAAAAPALWLARSPMPGAVKATQKSYLHSSILTNADALLSTDESVTKLENDRRDQQQDEQGQLKRPKKRSKGPPLSGVFAVWKPTGMTSRDAVNVIQSRFARKYGWGYKVGHGGTLDRMAEGVLIIGVGNGCKELQRFLKGTKRYHVRAEFGVATDTFDSTGNIICRRPYEHVTTDMINEKLLNYRGDFLQKPPSYSAIKQNGVRYSDRARLGDVVRPDARPVTVYDVALLELSLPSMYLDVRCGSGTYMRSLVHDLAEDLDTAAHARLITRLQQGPFTEENALRYEDWTVRKIKRVVASLSENLDQKVKED